MGTISFSGFPASWRVPGVYVELDDSRVQANPTLTGPTLILGQKTVSSTGAVATAHRVTSAAQAQTLAGDGSIAAQMAERYLQNDRGADRDLRLMLCADAAGATQATGRFAIVGPASGAGELDIWVGGRRIPVAVGTDDTANEVATAAVAAAGDVSNLGVTTAVVTTAVTLRMKHVANPLVNGKVLYVTQSSGNIGTFNADNSGGDADTTVTLSDATTIAILDNDASGVGTPDGTAVYYDEATDGLVSITETGADLFVLTSARLAIRVKYVASISGMKAVAFDDDAAPATDRVLFTATGAVNATAPLVTDYLACTARNAGTLGTDIDLRHTHLTGERLPAGLSVCAIPMYGGATDPTITALISAMGSERYDCVVHPWAATTQMDAVDTEIESRWTPQRGVMGFALTGAVDTVATLASFGNNRDKRFETVWTAGPNALNPPWELAAAASGVVAQRMRAVPAPRGVKDMALTGITALADGEGLTDADCQSLLVDGIAPLYCEGGKVRIRKWVSTYQTNDAAQESEARRDPIHAFDDMRMVRDMKAHLATVFANKRVTEDAVSTAPDTVPLSAITRAVDSRFLAYQGWGIVQDVEAFVANRVVEADDDVPTRVNILFPPVRVPELDQLGILLQPRLVTDDEAAAE